MNTKLDKAAEFILMARNMDIVPTHSDIVSEVQETLLLRHFFGVDESDLVNEVTRRIAMYQ